MKTRRTQERIGRVGPRRRVVIPQDILEALNLQAGDLVAFAGMRNGMLITPKRVVKTTVQSDNTLTPAEEKMVRRGEAEFKWGESKSWRDVKHALSL